MMITPVAQKPKQKITPRKDPAVTNRNMVVKLRMLVQRATLQEVTNALQGVLNTEVKHGLSQMFFARLATNLVIRPHPFALSAAQGMYTTRPRQKYYHTIFKMTAKHRT